MKSFLRQVALIITFIGFLFVSCNNKTEKTRNQIAKKDTIQTNESDYELANAFLLNLRKEKVDTIIFCKRTCINCCDFFNIFWASKGKRFLNKFYFDFADMKTHSVSIELSTDTIFSELSNNYFVLKTSSIKENGHKLKNGYTTLSIIDHYCYTQVSIFTPADSIVTDRIKDHSFQKFTAFDQKEKGQTNDSYLENISSKWNSFLKVIEGQLQTMTETKTRELETMRTHKLED